MISILYNIFSKFYNMIIIIGLGFKFESYLYYYFLYKCSNTWFSKHNIRFKHQRILYNLHFYFAFFIFLVNLFYFYKHYFKFSTETSNQNTKRTLPAFKGHYAIWSYRSAKKNISSFNIICLL